MRAIVTVDLGFGDAGKGLLTDYLVRRTGAKVVVRYNGGAQAGHNVVTPDGRHHTFAQFGSGTFVPGVRTFLSRDVVVHPTALLVEEARLRAAGVFDALERLRISGGALVITPYHQELNRRRESERGSARHGSCGVGFGETVGHSLAHPEDAVRIRDLGDEARLRAKLRRIRDYAQSEIADLEPWIEATRFVSTLTGDDGAWRFDDTVIFEGAQGVLLDQDHGFHPHTTWSTCTSAPALGLLSGAAPHAEVQTIGILRTYAVRHGAGPLPTESANVAGTPHDHNAFNEWQGAVRRGWFDGVLARYALEADGGIDALAITHLDWLPRLDRWTYCDGYAPDVALSPSERLTSLVESVRPLLRHCPATEEVVLETIEQITGKRVAIGSRGPSAADVFTTEVNRGVDRRREVGRTEGAARLAFSEY